jgi:hypothetical protein
MKTLPCLVALSLACVLCGCDTYRYNFDTVISEEGAIERTFDYTFEPYHSKKVTAEPVAEEDAVEQEDAEGDSAATAEVETIAEETEVEAPPAETDEQVERRMSALFVIPDPERFAEFERRPDGLRGTWRSDGRIQSDFRIITPSYTWRDAPVEKPEELPPTAEFLREAFNEGQVVRDDLVLITTLTYTEHFHDFYTAAESDKYGDMIIDLAGALMLDTLRTDLGDEYDLGKLEAYADETLAPLVKKWKRFYVYNALHPPFDEEERPKTWIARLTHKVSNELLRLDLLRLGVTVYDPDDDEELNEALKEWIIERMHELVVRRDDGTPWPIESVEDYFDVQPDPDEPGAERTPLEQHIRRLLVERYGDVDFFGHHLGAIYDSLALRSDHHEFTVIVDVPWPVISLGPKPESVEALDQNTTVEWKFDGVDLFPGGVHLSITCAQPAAEAQRKLFGRTVIETPEQLRRFVALVGRLQDDEREAFLAALRGCVESSSVENLASAVRERLPKDGFDAREALNRLILMLAGDGESVDE